MTLQQRESAEIFMFQWLEMWYCAAIALRLVEVTVRSESQMTGIVFIYVVNAVFNAILFGIYFDLVSVAGHAQNEFQARVDDTNTAMENINLPDKLTQQIRDYILQTHQAKMEQTEYIEFVKSMPPSKKS